MHVIKVSENNRLIFTNISHYKGTIHSVVKINGTSIILCKNNATEIYNKKYKKKLNKFDKDISEALVILPIMGIDRDKFLIVRS